MQTGLAASQWRVASFLRADWLRTGVLRRPAAGTLLMALLLLSVALASPPQPAPSGPPKFSKLFHLAGVPGLRTDQRVDAVFNPDAIVFQTRKNHYEVPYARIHQVISMRADRRYENTAALASIAPFGVGSLLILPKSQVDTVVLDYLNERGGKMGIVLQMNPSLGAQFRDALRQRGVRLVEPEPSPASAPAQTTATPSAEGKKP